ncbi:secreted protein [marine sediment metagenome]|uniref:Secreted protein n=1 Tax=marine sediment metagenome TaxID=412755 RepID=A0A1B6NRG2_9ZZZZ
MIGRSANTSLAATANTWFFLNSLSTLSSSSSSLGSTRNSR